MTVAISVVSSALILAGAFVLAARVLAQAHLSAANAIRDALNGFWSGQDQRVEVIDLDEVYKSIWAPEDAELVLETEFGDLDPETA